MRALLKVAAVLVPTLLLLTAAVAQTGEFTAAIPGEVIHRGYALQDEWQKLRNATASQPVGTLQKSNPPLMKSRSYEEQEAARRRNN